MFGPKTKEVIIEGTAVKVTSLSAVEAIAFRDELKKDTKDAMFFLVKATCTYEKDGVQVPVFDSVEDVKNSDARVFEQLITEATDVNGIMLNKRDIDANPKKGRGKR